VLVRISGGNLFLDIYLNAKVVISYLNWAAPCLWLALDQKVQASLMGALVNLHGCHMNLGALLLPNYVREKGTLWRAEEATAEQTGPDAMQIV